MNVGERSWMRLFHEVCPLKIGDTVSVSPNFIHAGDWRGRYIVTGMRWEYQRGAGHDINISIASEEEICARDGDTDGFEPRDLIFIGRPQS